MHLSFLSMEKLGGVGLATQKETSAVPMGSKLQVRGSADIELTCKMLKIHLDIIHTSNNSS